MRIALALSVLSVSIALSTIARVGAKPIALLGLGFACTAMGINIGLIIARAIVRRTPGQPWPPRLHRAEDFTRRMN